MPFVTGKIAVNWVKKRALKAQVKARHTDTISSNINIKLMATFDLLGFIGSVNAIIYN